MSRRRLFLGAGALVIVLGVVGGIFYFKNSQQPRSCTTAIPVDEDMQTALSYGLVFEAPQWAVESENHEFSVSVLWRDESGLGHLDYLRYNCGLRKIDLDEYKFDISLGGYDSYQETAVCENDDLRLREFDTVSGGVDYRTRFWLQPVNDTRLVAFQLSFPVTRQDDLDLYSARLFPMLSGCG